MLLYNLGLFKGTGTTADGSPQFDLDRAPTRAEAVTILVRLLGAEEAATQKTIATPFTDVPAWAKPYVGYAYSKGYTNGVDAKHFGPNNTVSAAQFLTFLLRALGYKDGTDFTWDSPWTLTDQLGISNGAYNAKTKTFLLPLLPRLRQSGHLHVLQAGQSHRQWPVLPDPASDHTGSRRRLPGLHRPQDRGLWLCGDHLRRRGRRQSRHGVLHRRKRQEIPPHRLHLHLHRHRGQRQAAERHLHRLLLF